MLTLTSDEIEDLIRRVISHGPPEWVTQDNDIRRLKVIGSLFHNVPSLNSRSLEVAAARIGCSSVRLGWDNVQHMATESIRRESDMFSKALDVIVTAFLDRDTFADGRRVVEQIGNTSSIPLVNLVDDVYAPQSSLAIIAALWERLGGFKGKKIAVSWGFGSKHVLPSTAHSLCLMGATLGADILVVAPQEFPLLSRVLRETKERIKTADSQFEERHNFESFEGIDAVYAMNWCRLDDFNRLERNTEYASKYRNWHFTDEVLPSESLFITDLPIQAELLAARSVIDSENNITPDMFAWLVRALLGSISYVTDDKTEQSTII